jgi:hypothetical protein
MSIDIRIDDRIRLVASVLLLTKFVDENSGWQPHPLRTGTLAFLRAYESHPCITASREIAGSQWMSAFYCYAVLLEPEAGTFALRPDAVPAVYNARFVKDFEERGYSDLLRRFYEDTEIARFWSRTEDLWREVLEDCRYCLQGCGLDEFLSLFFGAFPCRLAVVPNPLDPPTFGFGPSDGTTAYAIWGPPAVPPDSEEPVRYARYGNELARSVFHEFAHSLWDDARKGYPALMEKTLPLEDEMVLKGWFPTMYPTWEQRLDEIVIRAATARSTLKCARAKRLRAPCWPGKRKSSE